MRAFRAHIFNSDAVLVDQNGRAIKCADRQAGKQSKERDLQGLNRPSSQAGLGKR